MGDLPSPKMQVQVLLDKLPAECSLEDVRYHLYVTEKINRGLESSESEGVLSQAKVKQRLAK